MRVVVHVGAADADRVDPDLHLVRPDRERQVDVAQRQLVLSFEDERFSHGEPPCAAPASPPGAASSAASNTAAPARGTDVPLARGYKIRISPVTISAPVQIRSTIDPAAAQKRQPKPPVDRDGDAQRHRSMASVCMPIAASATGSEPERGERGAGRTGQAQRDQHRHQHQARRRAPSPSGTTRRPARPCRWSCRRGRAGGARAAYVGAQNRSAPARRRSAAAAPVDHQPERSTTAQRHDGHRQPRGRARSAAATAPWCARRCGAVRAPPRTASPWPG